MAAVALFFAVISAYSNVGVQRSAAATTPQPPAPPSSTVETTLQRTTAAELRMQLSDNMEETRRLAEAVHALSGDRDQLSTRLAAIEHNLEGVTGSIKRDRAASASPPPPAQQAPPPSAPIAAPATAPAAPARVEAARPDNQVASVAPAALPPIPVASAPPAAPEAAPNPPPVSRGEATKSAAVASAPEPEHSDASPEQVPAPGLGVDVGGAANFESLRSLWHITKNNDPSLLDEFYPVVATRENGRTHAPELRLIIGPMPDAEAAAQLCVTLAAAHQYCQPVAFEGQRLTVAEAAPRTPPVRHRAAAASASATNPVSGFKVVPAYPAGK